MKMRWNFYTILAEFLYLGSYVFFVYCYQKKLVQRGIMADKATPTSVCSIADLKKDTARDEDQRFHGYFGDFRFGLDLAWSYGWNVLAHISVLPSQANADILSSRPVSFLCGYRNFKFIQLHLL